MPHPAIVLSVAAILALPLMGGGCSSGSGGDDGAAAGEETAGGETPGPGTTDAGTSEGAEGAQPAEGGEGAATGEGPEGAAPEGSEGETGTEGPEGAAEGAEGEAEGGEGPEGEPDGGEGPEGAEGLSEGTEGDIPIDTAGCLDTEWAIECQDSVPEPPRVIILGDSISEGCCVLADLQYPVLLKAKLDAFYSADVEMIRAAHGGWTTSNVKYQVAKGDPLLPIDEIYGDGKSTITVMTVGGNDMVSQLGQPLATAMKYVDTTVKPNVDFIFYTLTDPANFPGGNKIYFANIYDPSDGTLDFRKCGLAGSSIGNQGALIEAFEYGNQAVAEFAYLYKLDMIKLWETFMGHGWVENPTDSAKHKENRWFDITCIHPTEKGHEVIADLFFQAITKGPDTEGGKE